jgi:acetyl-CoA synthetase
MTKAEFPFGQEIVWKPDPDVISRTNLQRFMDRFDLQSYDDLMQRSVRDPIWFWDAVLTDLDIQFYQPYDTILDTAGGIRFPVWCRNGKMNIIHNCLDKWQNTSRRDQAAVIHENESGDTGVLTYRELYDAVNVCAAALKAMGYGKGDVIALYMPMIPELLIAFLAVIKIGGIILPLFSGYGPGAVRTRLADAGAKALFTVDGTIRRGRPVTMKPNADTAVSDLPGFRNIFVHSYAGLENLAFDPKRDISWADLFSGPHPSVGTEPTAAEDILMIIYTSGTTGRPKGAVHTHCGFPVKAAQDMFHCMDLKHAEVMYWMSDMGWMMGPWEVFGSLIIGATMVFYDGAPDHPDADRVWRQVGQHGVTHLGVSPTLIRTIREVNDRPQDDYDLSSLRMIGSTGSPWDPESWLWLFRNVLGSTKPIINYSGGTEISGGIVSGNFFKPLKPCAFSGPVPGMDADVVDDAGNSVRSRVGELVIRSPWIGMTRGFWNDRERYLETYWQRWPNIWYHGDFAAIDEDGLWYILGRSDDTIKVSGKRIGPAEVESVLNAHPLVMESAVIGVPHAVKGEELVAYCVLAPDRDPDEKLRTALVELLIGQLGKPLKPREIKFTRQLPKTRNAKVMHRLIRSVYLNREPGDLSSLEDPAALDAIRDAV